MKLSDLSRIEGTIDRGPYVVCGLTLFFIKFNLDRWISWHFYNHPWNIYSYLWNSGGPLPSSNEHLLLLLISALPFIFLGVVLTLKRLRSVGLTPFLVILFFVPYINLLFFTLLSFTPSKDRSLTKQSDATLNARLNILSRCIPDNRWGAAGLGILITALLGVLLTFFSTSFLQTYGWGLFVGMPFICSLISVAIYAIPRERNRASCLGVGFSTVILIGIALLLFAFEGVVCIVMAAPLAIPLGLLGGLVGYEIQKRVPRSGMTNVAGCFALALPMFMGAESLTPSPNVHFAVRSSIDIAAPIEVVWENVVSFREIPAPEEFIFKTGISYPVRARIYGEGVGAVRHCEFSTGTFVEPIEIWQPPTLLKFSVLRTPPPMQEWSFYSDLHPPHIENYFASVAGQFALVALDKNSTRVEGTTWYYNKVWPSQYWKLWSDWIIHAIHNRVLQAVKTSAESSAN